MKSTFARAEATRAAGEKKLAEHLYVEVFSYFFLYTDAYVRQQFADLHICAAGRLIQLRRGDLDALQGMWLAPFVREVHGAALDKAIVEAGGTLKSRKDLPAPRQ